MAKDWKEFDRRIDPALANIADKQGAAGLLKLKALIAATREAEADDTEFSEAAERVVEAFPELADAIGWLVRH